MHSYYHMKRVLDVEAQKLARKDAAYHTRQAGGRWRHKDRSACVIAGSTPKGAELPRNHEEDNDASLLVGKPQNSKICARMFGIKKNAENMSPVIALIWPSLNSPSNLSLPSPNASTPTPLMTKRSCETRGRRRRLSQRTPLVVQHVSLPRTGVDFESCLELNRTQCTYYYYTHMAY